MVNAEESSLLYDRTIKWAVRAVYKLGRMGSFTLDFGHILLHQGPDSLWVNGTVGVGHLR